MRKILLTIILLTGISVSLSAGEIQDYKKACDSGDFNKCNILAMKYRFGMDNLIKDSFKALDLYTKSCKSGDGEGVFFTWVYVLYW